MAMYRVGVQLQPQHTTWASYAEAVRHAEAIGVDTIFNWDHFYPLSGDPDGKHFECMTTLTAMAMLSTRAEVGTLVTCNSYRNPNLLADMARTIDHISGGRLILGIGAGWFQKDYDQYGYEFGTAGSRIKALDESLPVIIERWTKLNPSPTRYIPIMVGGSGERKTLRITARYANIWNSFGPPETYKHKNEVLNQWCQEVGRPARNIERSVTIFKNDLDNLNAFAEAGATHFILGMSEPWDFSAVEKLVAWRDK